VRDGEEYTSVAAAEDLVVEVTFVNPLALKLKLTNVRLLCEFQPDAPRDGGADGGGAVSGAAGAAAAAPLGLSSSSPPAAAGGGSAAAAAEQPDAFIVQIVTSSFTLHPSETLTEKLTLRPLAPGWLRVTGVTWTVDGEVDGRVTFEIKGRHRKRPKGDRPSQRKHYPPRRRLFFHVLPGMPRLAISTEGLPARVFGGELLRIPVTITNIGRLPARNLKLAVADSAGVAIAGEGAAAAGEGAAGVLQRGAAGESLEPCARRRKDGRDTLLFQIPAAVTNSSSSGGSADDGELQPGQSVQAVMWLHAPSAAGAWEFNCVWYCEPVASVPLQMRFRSLRTAHTVTVAPLMGVAPGVTPSGSDLLQYMLRVDLECDRVGGWVGGGMDGCVDGWVGGSGDVFVGGCLCWV